MVCARESGARVEEHYAVDDSAHDVGARDLACGELFEDTRTDPYAAHEGGEDDAKGWVGGEENRSP